MSHRWTFPSRQVAISLFRMMSGRSKARLQPPPRSGQLYSVTFLQERIIVKKECLLSHSRFASIVFDRVLGPMCLAWYTWRYPWFLVVLKARYTARLGALKGFRVSSKSSLKVRDREVAGRNEGGNILPMRSHIFFCKNVKQSKNGLVARPANPI